MLFPTLNLDIPTSKVLYAVIGIFAVGTFIMLGYALGTNPKEVVCKDYIQELQISNSQISELEKELEQNTSKISLECVTREKKICSDLIDATTENIRKLRCKICKAKGVH